MSSYNIPFINIRKENHPKLSQICIGRVFFLGNQERVQNSRGKRAVSIRAEVLLYICNHLRLRKRLPIFTLDACSFRLATVSRF